LAALAVGALSAGAAWGWRAGVFDAAGAAVLAQLDRAAVAAGFTVQEVFVVGRVETGAEELRAAVGAERGDSMLAFDPEAARARLLRLGWVKDATVRRRLPNAIDVAVVERRPFALWQEDGRLALVDREGEVITRRRLDRFARLPLVVGEEAARHAAPLIDALALQPKLYAEVEAAVRVGGRRWNVELKNGVEVNLPEEGAAEAWGRLAELEARQSVLSKDIVAIDMRLPDRLVVRLTPEAAQRRRNPGKNA
jgi:cell division protein FtsQ